MTFLVCCILYSVVISVLKIEHYKPINQLQGNKIAKEDFYFDDGAMNKNFIVGSSLSYRLEEQYFPSSYENLALGGSSSLNGLSLLKSKDFIPELLLIETNILTRTKNLKSVRSLKRPKSFSTEEEFFKSNFKITRQKYQPVSFALNVVYGLFSNDMDEGQKSISKKARSLMEKKQKENYNIPLEKDSSMLIILDNLQFYVDYYTEKGTTVHFMELPISCEISQSKKAVSSRNLMKEFFPPSKYSYLDNLTCTSITTTDGTHLDKISAKLMAEHILSEVERKENSR